MLQLFQRPKEVFSFPLLIEFQKGGKSWKILRRCSLTTMRDFGTRKQSIEKLIQDETQCLLEELWKSQGKHCSSIVFGECFNYQDPRFLQLLNVLSEVFTTISSLYSQRLAQVLAFLEMLTFFSGILKHFPGTSTRLSSLIQKVDDFVTEVIAVHRKTLDPSAPEDVIDSVLLLMDKARTLLDW
ncbi:hypothetical protein QTO34_010361, partial [Cnephaeus nilssonii]